MFVARFPLDVCVLRCVGHADYSQDIYDVTPERIGLMTIFAPQNEQNVIMDV